MKGHFIPVQMYGFFLRNNNNNCIYILIIVFSTWGTAMITNPLLSALFIDKEEEKKQNRKP